MFFIFLGINLITVQQVLEKVAIYRAKLLLQLLGNTNDIKDCEHACSKCSFILSQELCNLFNKLPELEDSLANDVKESLLYVAGYVVRRDSDDHVEDTFSYYDKYGDFTKELNRGGLKIPSDSVCQWVFYSYIMFQQVVNDTCRTSLCKLLMMIAEFFDFDLKRNHGLILANVLFNNYVHLYSPRSSRELKQKVIKLSVTE